VGQSVVQVVESGCRVRVADRERTQHVFRHRGTGRGLRTLAGHVSHYDRVLVVPETVDIEEVASDVGLAARRLVYRCDLERIELRHVRRQQPGLQAAGDAALAFEPVGVLDRHPGLPGKNAQRLELVRADTEHALEVDDDCPEHRVAFAGDRSGDCMQLIRALAEIAHDARATLGQRPPRLVLHVDPSEPMRDVVVRVHAPGRDQRAVRGVEEVNAGHISAQQ
jgi:hypothetical protein